MKVEQACRFRTEEGYGITARSPGFTQNQEKVLAEIFNDSMLPVIEKLGSSILTCAVRGSYAFYSRNTLRTHETRRAIFTHSYILPVETYAEMMRQVPQKLLAVPISALLDVQGGGDNLDAVEFPGTEYGELSLEEIQEKYNLTPERYSLLLMGAYQAMTSNRSLRLCTDTAPENRERLVRELTYCIVDGLLPVMKGRVTFSSGMDTRMNISLLYPGTTVRSGEPVFGVEDNRYTNIQYWDDLSTICFRQLGSADREERRKLLQKMENWLGAITNVEDNLTLMLICASYIYCREQPMSHDLALSLFCKFVKAAGRSLSLPSANGLLTALVKYMVENNMVSINLLSNIAEWYLMDSSQDFRRNADKALQQAPEHICVALLAIVTKMPVSENLRELIYVLVHGIRPDSPELTEEVKLRTVHWIIRENAVELAGFCNAVTDSYTAAEITALARKILEDSQGRRMNAAEVKIVAEALKKMLQKQNADIRFQKEDYILLDQHLFEFSGNAMKVLVANCILVRIPLYDAFSEQVDLLLALGEKKAEFHKELEDMLSGHPRNDQYAKLWEHYQTKRIFDGKEITGDKIPELCKTYNTFASPCGFFEQQVELIWCPYARKQLSEMAEQTAQGIRPLDDLAVRFLKLVESMRLSAEMRSKLKQFVVDEFWSLITYVHIMEEKTIQVSHELRTPELPNGVFKYRLLTSCGRMLKAPDQSQELIDLIMHTPLPDGQRNQVQEVLWDMAGRVLYQYGFVSWDLLLLQCWDNGNVFDFTRLNNKLLYMDETFLRQLPVKLNRDSALYSQLLLDREIYKLVKKNISQDHIVVRQMLEATKERGSIFHMMQKDTGGYAQQMQAEREPPAGKKGLLSRFGRKGK